MSFLGLKLELGLGVGSFAVIIFQKLLCTRKMTIYTSISQQKLISLSQSNDYIRFFIRISC